MSISRMLLDPTAENAPAGRQRLARPAWRQGLTVGLLDISKARGDVFLDKLAGLLADKGLQVKRFMKPTFARVAPAQLQQELADGCDVVVEASAD